MKFPGNSGESEAGVPAKKQGRVGNCEQSRGGTVVAFPGCSNLQGARHAEFAAADLVRVGADHFAAVAGGELLINTELCGNVVLILFSR